MLPRLLLVILMLFAAACRQETATETPTPAPTATTASEAPSQTVCDMLTMDELKTAAGVDGGVGESSSSGGAEVCTWTGTNGKVVIVQVFPSASSYDSARSSFEGLYGTTAQDLPGVGDKAYYIDGSTGRMPTGTLVAQKGQKPVSVQVMGGTGSAEIRRGEATAVAHLILGKL